MMKRSSSQIQVALVAAMCCWIFPALVPAARAQESGKPPLAKQAQSEEAAKQERKKELDEMRRRAEGTTIVRLDGSDRSPAKLVAEPLMRYSDQIILIMDATLWAYGAKGRPLALQKVECYRHPSFPKYLYALFSLSDGLIEARWPGESGWSSTKPAIEMRILPGAPQPAAKESGRLVQMKEALRRFAVTMTGWQDRKDEMRLLSRPLYRYADPGSGLQDGAIFAFVTYGTNPNFLILIELQGADVEHAVWKYASLRMTDGGLNLRLDDKEVWSADSRVNSSGRYDTWLYFHARQQQRAR
jgi:hypothetical protein